MSTTTTINYCEIKKLSQKKLIKIWFIDEFIWSYLLIRSINDLLKIGFGWSIGFFFLSRYFFNIAKWIFLWDGCSNSILYEHFNVNMHILLWKTIVNRLNLNCCCDYFCVEVNLKLCEEFFAIKFFLNKWLRNKFIFNLWNSFNLVIRLFPGRG